MDAVTAILNKLRKAGWTIEQGRNCHLKIYDPAGRYVCTHSSTPSRGRYDGRAFKNFRAQLRRAGAPID